MIHITNGYIQYKFTNWQDANAKFIEIIKWTVRHHRKEFGNDFGAWDLGWWMVLVDSNDNPLEYIMPSNLINILENGYLDKITVDNLQEQVMQYRVKAYKENSH